MMHFKCIIFLKTIVAENKHSQITTTSLYSYRVLYSEYLDYFHIELHFINVGMRHQILLTKQASLKYTILYNLLYRNKDYKGMFMQKI